MEREDRKNMMPEEEYLKQMSSLPKVKAPDDFLEKVRERIERRSAFEKIMRTLFVPVKIKVPLEVAAMAAAIILIVSTSGIKKPVEQLAYVPKAKMAASVITEGAGRKDEKVFANKGAISADLSSNVAAPASTAENKPVEIALLVRTEEPVAKMRAAQILGSTDRVEMETSSLEKKAFRLEEKASFAGKPYFTEALSKVKNQVELAHGKVTNIETDKDTGMPQYIDAEIPAAGYPGFIENLSGIGVLQEPILKEAPQGLETVRVRIKLASK